MTTRRACLELDAIEHKFLGAMAQTQTYRVSDASLELLGADGVVVLRFKPRKF
jgi:hypothetical protein